MAPTVTYRTEIAPRSGFFSAWERRRNSKPVHWFVECFAEALGVFFYVYAGVGSTASYVVGNILEIPGIGSVLQIGFAYAFGILMALGVCSATSGGHFNPCVTIAAVVMKGFPPRKALRYITAQILGGYIACLLVYVQWRDMILGAEQALTAAGKLQAIQFTPSGTAGIFGLYTNPGVHLGNVFLNEFVTDVFLALVIWASLDPTNILIPPQMLPWFISFAYGVAVWSFGTAGLAANSARDIGGRLAAMTIYGMEASGGKYAAIAALTNIPATLLAAFVYETMLADSDRVVPKAHIEHISAQMNHRRNPEANIPQIHNRHSSSTSSKHQLETIEHSHARV